jgi:hypothetical protein
MSPGIQPTTPECEEADAENGSEQYHMPSRKNIHLQEFASNCLKIADDPINSNVLFFLNILHDQH